VALETKGKAGILIIFTIAIFKKCFVAFGNENMKRQAELPYWRAVTGN
jgi:hypothetical protein